MLRIVIFFNLLGDTHVSLFELIQSLRRSDVSGSLEVGEAGTDWKTGTSEGRV